MYQRGAAPVIGARSVPSIRTGRRRAASAGSKPCATPTKPCRSWNARATRQVARERVEPEAPCRLRLRPAEERRSDPLPVEADAHVELRHGRARRRDEADEPAVEHREAHVVAREDFGQEVRPLLGDRMGIGHPDARFEALAPHRDELVEPGVVVSVQRCGVHRRRLRRAASVGFCAGKADRGQTPSSSYRCSTTSRPHRVPGRSSARRNPCLRYRCAAASSPWNVHRWTRP